MVKRRTFIAGVGMTEFFQPGSRDADYVYLGKMAGNAALNDANILFPLVDAVVASYCYGEPTCGQRVVSELGLTGIPVFNTNNNCSSASSAIFLARTLVEAGRDCVLALGFETMESGLTEQAPDKPTPWKKHFDQLDVLSAKPGLVRPGLNQLTSNVIKMFAYAAREYMNKYPCATFEHFVDIAHKNRTQGLLNHRASLSKEISKEEIAKKTMLCFPITLGMSTPTANGAAAAVIVSENFLRRFGSHGPPIEIIAQAMVTDLPNSFSKSFIDLCGYSMAKLAAEKCYIESGYQPKDIDILEVHDCFSCNELFMYEALGLAEPGKGIDLLSSGKWIDSKEGSGKLFKLGGVWIVNPSGGLESKGHPIGATGLAQCAELVWQLRGEASMRQVPGNPRIALQHNFGLGSAAVVTMYKRCNLPLSDANVRGSHMTFSVVQSKF